MHTPLDVNLKLRPDIAYAVSAVSQFMQEAIASSGEEALRLIDWYRSRGRFL